MLVPVRCSPQNTCAPSRHKEFKSWIIEHQELASTWPMCRAAFTTEVFDFMANSVLGLQIMPELQCLKKRKENSASSRKHIYISEEKKMHSYSQKCQSDQQRLEVLMYLSLTYRFFSLYLLFTWMCTHFVQNIAALFSLSLKLHYLPLFLYEKWHTLLWAPT